MSVGMRRVIHEIHDPDPAIRRAAIIGAGPAGIIAYAALRYRGLGAHDIAVFDDRPALSAWTERTEAILQREMRSESDGHMFPSEYPGFALLDSVRRISPLPLLLSAVNRYHPVRQDIQRHGLAIAQYFELSKSLTSSRVARLAFSSDPEPHAVILDTSGAVVGRASHVLLALGHGELRWPDAIAERGVRQDLGSAVTHAYERKTYGPSTYLVVGSGMAASAEWTNVLAAGGKVIALRRNPAVLEQALSAPRCYFGGPLLDQFHRMGPDERTALLRTTARGSYPSNGGRERQLASATREGRMENVVGTLVELRAHDGALQATVEGPLGVSRFSADVLIAATGFQSGWSSQPVLRDLVTSLGVETNGEFLVLNEDCTVPMPGAIGVTVTVTGPAARWAYPPADSFAGMKYVARRFADTVFGARAGLTPGPFAWWRLVRAGSPPRERKTARENHVCASP